MQSTKCTHDFTYLIKKYDDVYTGRVLQIPAVMVSSQDIKKIDDKIKSAISVYLKRYSDEHEKAKNDEFKPVLQTPKEGIIIETRQIKITC